MPGRRQANVQLPERYPSQCFYPLFARANARGRQNSQTSTTRFHLKPSPSTAALYCTHRVHQR